LDAATTERSEATTRGVEAHLPDNDNNEKGRPNDCDFHSSPIVREISLGEGRPGRNVVMA
jgi:hypothetical protein